MTNIDSITISQALLAKACLEASYWWVHYEQDFHEQFSLWCRKTVDHLSQDDFKVFTDFTTRYSLSRNLKGGDDTKKSLLRKLSANGLFDQVKDGTITVVDDLSAVLGEQHKTQTSLLSKLATLCNPIDFTMYDRLAKIGLAYMLMGQQSMRKHNSYQVFLDDWEKFAVRCFTTVDNHLIDNHYDYLVNHFDVNRDLLSRPIYGRRVVDKYLWLLGQKESNR